MFIFTSTYARHTSYPVSASTVTTKKLDMLKFGCFFGMIKVRFRVFPRKYANETTRL